jgi:hypothetical protein
MDIYYDMTNRRVMNSVGVAVSQKPFFTYQDYSALSIYLKNNALGVLTAANVSSIVSWAISVDVDFSHDTIEGALTASKTGAITTVTADGFLSAPPQTGVLHLTNRTGDTEAVGYSSWSSNGSVYTFRVAATLTYTYANDDVCVAENTAPCIRVDDADIDNANAATGILVATMDCDTATFSSAVGALDSKDGYLELRGYNAQAKQVFCERFPITLKNLIDPNVGELPGPTSNYNTKAETLALLRAGRNIEYSINGSTSWHETQAEADRYWRERYPDGEWGDAIAMVIGPTGPAAAALQIEYSIDGATLWHGTWSDGDRYLRTSVNGGTSWGGAVLIVAPDVEFEYSIDGATLWHTPWVDGDLYMRQSTDGGITWSDEIRLVGPATMIEYSIDGATLWHKTFTNGDLYLRISVDGGVTWGDPSLFVADVKADHEFDDDDLVDDILTITGVVPVACIVDNTGDVVEVASINYATDTTISLAEYTPITGTWRVRFAQGGTTGPQGITGATPALTIGTVTSGTPAAATITGTDLNPVLNLTIPEGKTGATPDITVEVETGDAGTDASAEVTGTAEAPVITFTIPRGAAGADGSGSFESRTSDYAATAENAGKTWMRTDASTPTCKIVAHYQGGEFFDAFTQAFSTSEGGFSNYSIRVAVPGSLISTSGGMVKVTFTAPSASFAIDNASIVERDSGAVGTTTPTELTFSTASGFSLTSGQTITSDALEFAIDETKDYLITMDGKATDDTYAKATGVTGAATYYRVGNNYNLASFDEPSTRSGEVFSVSKIEVATLGDVYAVKTFTLT